MFKPEQTSKKPAKLAGKTLRNPRASKVSKSPAGFVRQSFSGGGPVLTQAPDKPGKTRKRRRHY